MRSNIGQCSKKYHFICILLPISGNKFYFFLGGIHALSPAADRKLTRKIFPVFIVLKDHFLLIPQMIR
jgi:hypothetical protein